MKIITPIILCVVWATLTYAQMPSATEVLNKSIQYHDPKNTWGAGMLTLKIEESRPDAPARMTHVEIDLTKDYFKMAQQRGNNRIERMVKNGECSFWLNGNANIPADTMQKMGLTCDRSISTRNYYTYLWGLPMKLKDPGTILNEQIEMTDFFGKKVYQLRVTYDEKVGSDVWFFYFNSQNYALVGYKFYHNEAKKDGEYIILEEEANIHSMRIPKIRKWYLNQGDKFLATDTLIADK